MQTPAFRLPVLAYHHIDSNNNGRWSVSPASFRRHLEWIADHGGVCSPQAALRAFKAGEPAPPGVAITFDDAYEGLLHEAFPALKAHGMKAFIFAISRYVGTWDSWNTRAERKTQHIDWDGLCGLDRDGHAIGSHTRTHQALSKFDRERTKSELHGSADDIEANIGSSPVALAYPFGAYNNLVIGVAKKRYTWAFASGSKGSCDWRRRPHEVHRITVLPEWPLEELARRVELYGLASD